MESFLSGHNNAVITHHGHPITHNAPVTSGDPQGTVLGSILFLNFINNFPEWDTRSKVKLFADECIIGPTKTTFSSSMVSTALVRNLRVWLTEFNPSQCQTVTVLPVLYPLSTIITPMALYSRGTKSISQVSQRHIPRKSEVEQIHPADQGKQHPMSPQAKHMSL